MKFQDLLKASEGKTLEFKRDLSSPNTILRTIAAFANTAGGVVLIGIEDKSHDVYGVDDPLDAEERLANLISDKIDPRLLPSIEIHPWRKTHLVAVEVFPGSNRPYYVRELGPEQGVYVRVGYTNRKADGALIEELRRAARNQTYDEEAILELNSEAIDFRAVCRAVCRVTRH